MYCFSKSLIVIRIYHHFTHRAANHCCQSLSRPTDSDSKYLHPGFIYCSFEIYYLHSTNDCHSRCHVQQTNSHCMFPFCPPPHRGPLTLHTDLCMSAPDPPPSRGAAGGGCPEVPAEGWRWRGVHGVTTAVCLIGLYPTMQLPNLLVKGQGKVVC